MTVHVIERTKPDGRALTLYANAPFSVPEGAMPQPEGGVPAGAPQLRWHPLRGEWITYAAYRQHRTFLPPPQYDPLAPTTDAAAPTELPAGDWEIAVFDNRFPSLALPAGVATMPAVPADGPDDPTVVLPAAGRCEVVVFGPDAMRPLAALPLARIELLLRVWADRARRLAAQGAAWVLPFENRGVEMGVTLHHPHGQLYAYPLVPPVPARMAAIARAHAARHGTGPLTAMIARERRDGARLVYDGDAAVAFVPPCARWPYEVWVAPQAPVAGFEALDDAQVADLARALKSVLMRYDALWARPMPYLMAWYAAPAGDAAGWHLHAELWPPYRTRDRLKYLAGTELAAGFFAMDALPEDSARVLRAIDVDPEAG